METFNSARSSPLSPINAVVADHGTMTTLEEITIFDPRSLTTVWHPKATPYRLLVLVVGIVLGTLKTVFGFKGMVLVSTTLEWALGTIIFIVFYILQLFEENSRTHGRHRSWFFGYDCMNLLWRLLERFNIPPPVYSTFEEFDPQLCGGQLVVTNYRVLLSFAVIIFGFVKAVLTYRNLSLSASIIDLIFGVVATPILYVVGLYEDNPSKRLPLLFNRNDSWTIYKIGGYGDLFFFLLWTNCLLTGEYVFKVFIFEVGLMGSISPLLIPMFIRGYISMALGIFHYVERALPRTIGRDLRHIISAAFPVAFGYCMSILVFLTLFGPVVSVQLLRPYFEQDRVLGRWFISLQQRYSMPELPMLIRIIQRLGAYVKKSTFQFWLNRNCTHNLY
ncbi:hypothetical protein BJ165DRAFT_437670 [Panaeolus papilionaceus]|nr:hypothetical protein BJ165DRAFT_437670 [Panaeolus papilionaceus]